MKTIVKQENARTRSHSPVHGGLCAFARQMLLKQPNRLRHLRRGYLCQTGIARAIEMHHLSHNLARHTGLATAPAVSRQHGSKQPQAMALRIQLTLLNFGSQAPDCRIGLAERAPYRAQRLHHRVAPLPDSVIRRADVFKAHGHSVLILDKCQMKQNQHIDAQHFL